MSEEETTLPAAYRAIEELADLGEKSANKDVFESFAQKWDLEPEQWFALAGSLDLDEDALLRHPIIDKLPTLKSYREVGQMAVPGSFGDMDEPARAGAILTGFRHYPEGVKEAHQMLAAHLMTDTKYAKTTCRQWCLEYDKEEPTPFIGQSTSGGILSENDAWLETHLASKKVDDQSMWWQHGNQSSHAGSVWLTRVPFFVPAFGENKQYQKLFREDVGIKHAWFQGASSAALFGKPVLPSLKAIAGWDMDRKADKELFRDLEKIVKETYGEMEMPYELSQEESDRARAMLINTTLREIAVALPFPVGKLQFEQSPNHSSHPYLRHVLSSWHEEHLIDYANANPEKRAEHDGRRLQAAAEQISWLANKKIQRTPLTNLRQLGDGVTARWERVVEVMLAACQGPGKDVAYELGSMLGEDAWCNTFSADEFIRCWNIAEGGHDFMVGVVAGAMTAAKREKCWNRLFDVPHEQQSIKIPDPIDLAFEAERRERERYGERNGIIDKRAAIAIMNAASGVYSGYKRLGREWNYKDAASVYLQLKALSPKDDGFYSLGWVTWEDAKRAKEHHIEGKPRRDENPMLSKRAMWLVQSFTNTEMEIHKLMRKYYPDVDRKEDAKEMLIMNAIAESGLRKALDEAEEALEKCDYRAQLRQYDHSPGM